MTVAGQIRHCRVCDAEAVKDRSVRSVMREVFGSDGGPLRRTRLGTEPAELRRRWAAAMSLRAFGTLGIADGEKEVLVVGPGNDEAIYWLTRRTRRVFATDLSLAEGAWEIDGTGPILVDPDRQSTLPWNPNRLVLQPMPKGELRYDDGSVGALLCGNALQGADPRTLAHELHRVLKPGGAAAISVALRLQGPPGGSGEARPLDEPELREALLGPELSWALSDPLEVPESPGGPVSRKGERVWTTAHLLLVKPLYH